MWLYGYDGTTFKNFIGFNYASNAVSIPADGNNLYVDNASGKVGIGLNNPSKKLEVAGSIKVGTNDSVFSSYLVSNSPLTLQAPAGTTRMFISDGTGNVGIGTASPTRKLHVREDIDGVAALVIDNQSAGTGSQERIEFDSEDGSGTSGAFIAVFDNSNPLYPATMRFANALTGGAFDFIAGGAFRMVIDNGGNVGIGTATPQNRLDVEGGAVIGASFSGSNAAPANGLLVEGRVGIGTISPGTKLQVEDQISTSVTGTSAPGFTFTGDLNTGMFETVPDELGLATNGLDRLHITSGGDVGIGTTSPAQKLHVVGNAQVSGTLAVGGGTPIVGVSSASAVIDFPATAAQSSSELGLAVAGTAVGDVISLGISGGGTVTLTNSCYTAYCNVAGTVTIRFNNYSAIAQNPASGTFRVMVTKF